MCQYIITAHCLMGDYVGSTCLMVLTGPQVLTLYGLSTRDYVRQCIQGGVEM